MSNTKEALQEGGDPISDRILTTLLEGYEIAGTRYLQRAHYLGNNISQGEFKIDRHCYYGKGDRLYHITEVEAAIVFNQLSYVTIAHLLENGELSDLGRIEVEKFRRIQEEGAWIRKSTFDYKKAVNLHESQGSFKGALTISDVSVLERELDRSVRMRTSLRIEDNNITGERQIQLTFPK